MVQRIASIHTTYEIVAEKTQRMKPVAEAVQS